MMITKVYIVIYNMDIWEKFDMKKLLSLVVMLVLLGSVSAERPQVVVLSNEIDLGLNQELLGKLNESFDVLLIGSSDFPNYKGSPRIVILGGPDAKEVGGFAGEVLHLSWQDELRKNNGEKNVYIESSKWGSEQVVLVIAGNTRYDTQAIASMEKDRIVSLLNFKKPFSNIDSLELKTKIESGIPFTLLDVRPKTVFDLEHLKNAINIPFAELQTRYTELDRNKE